MEILQPTDWGDLLNFLIQFLVVSFAVLITVGMYAEQIKKYLIGARVADKQHKLTDLWDVIGDAVLTAERLYKAVKGAGPEKVKYVRDFAKLYAEAHDIKVPWELVDKMIERIFTQKKLSGELDKARGETE